MVSRAKIMLKADNGKFLYNHRIKNVITASRDEVNERCKFSLQVMYPILLLHTRFTVSIQGVKIRRVYKKILEAQNQAPRYMQTPFATNYQGCLLYLLIAHREH